MHESINLEHQRQVTGVGSVQFLRQQAQQIVRAKCTRRSSLLPATLPPSAVSQMCSILTRSCCTGNSRAALFCQLSCIACKNSASSHTTTATVTEPQQQSLNQPSPQLKTTDSPGTERPQPPPCWLIQHHLLLSVPLPGQPWLLLNCRLIRKAQHAD